MIALRNRRIGRHEHLKVSDQSHEDFKGLEEGALDPEDDLGELQKSEVTPRSSSRPEVFFTGKETHAKKKSIDLDNYMGELPGLEIEEQVFKKDSPSLMDDLEVETQEHETMLVGEMDWKQLFMNATDQCLLKSHFES
ncbi:hypothetical protein OIU85_016780 [Salix viminalis]|uniref:Uncharacterized protein n=1 Tax=Salix viminalis TaxID=40686 RepID=A0A9Q0V5X8_SALVM|nr:hypothetical protein OIU85_016780 [Salix viminalis]